VVLDGTLIPVDLVAADRPFYSGKHHKHGMNLQMSVNDDERQVVAAVFRPSSSALRTSSSQHQ
jgi:hypothetical protein